MPEQPHISAFLGDKGIEQIEPVIDPMTIHQQPIVLTFLGGSKIVLGEQTTTDGSSPCISLVSPNDPFDLASLVLWVDPISSQPMITLRTGPGQYQSYPLDKKFQSPYDKNWSPQGPAAHIGVPPTPPQNQSSK